MLKTSHACSIVTLLLVMLMSSAAWAATITGTVTNSTTTTGRIYLVLIPDVGALNFGTSIPSAGAYTITGVPEGNYTVRAFIDTVGTGVQHANDPRGTSAAVAVPATGTATVPSFALTAPTAVQPTAPAVGVFGGTGVNYVKWDAGTSNGYPIADRYTVRWSTSDTGTPSSDPVEVDSGFGDYFLHQGVGSLYYQVTAHVGGTSMPSEWVRVVNPSATLGSVTGTVSFPGVTAAGPLYVILVNEAAGYARVAFVPNATSPASYTVGMVPAGRYNIIAFLDRNNNGSYDVGDAGLRDTNDYRPHVTVANAQVTAPTVTLDGRNASTMITIGHGINDAAEEWFNLVVSAHSMARQVVGVEVVGTGSTASRVPQPVDLANQGNHFRTRIPMARQSVNDPYQLTITYADNSTEVVTERVSGVLDSFAVPVEPVGYASYSANPTFRWNTPSPAPSTDYVYTIWVAQIGAGGVWDAWRLPSSTTSVVYGSVGSRPTALVNGGRYSYIINITDQNGNLASREVAFFSPTSSAGVNSFSPIGGVAGTTVTINGVNFPTSPVVRFTGTTTNATVSAATPTSITAVVPVGATTGPITVLSGSSPGASQRPFVVAQLLSISGRAMTATATPAPVSGARVEVFGDSTRFTTTGSDGRFTLASVSPGEDLTLRITAPGFAPTYSATFADISQSVSLPYSFHLYTPAQFNGWVTTPGNGMIAGQVLNLGTPEPYTPLSGATVTARRSGSTTSYPVSYYDGSTATGSSTAANGTFLVFNLPNEENVDFSASRTGWTFWPPTLVVRGGGVTQGPILASAGTPPSIASFTPLSGKRGSTVVITGANFSTVAAENIVEFGTVRADVTAATATSLTVRVPATATTSRIRVTRAGLPSEPSFDLFTVLYTLNVTVTGNGTVTSVPTGTPSGISCVGGSSTAGCSSNFPSNSQVQLVPVGNSGAVLTAWGQSCSGAGICTVTMDADNKAVTATFSSGSSLIRIGTTPYATLQDAFNAVSNGSQVRMQTGQYPVTSVVYHLDAAARLSCGYDSTFTTNNNFSTLIGYLFIQNGKLTVDRLKIR